MRRGLLVSGLLFLLVMAYVLWPVAGFYQLAASIEARDAQALSRLVDFPALEKSLTKQFVRAYLEITGKRRERAGKPQLSLIERTVAINVGTSIAEPIVAQLINENTLLQLLTEGRLAMPGSKDATTATGTGPAAWTSASDGGLARHVWQIWLSSDYRGSSVSVRLPPGKPRSEQFRAKLSLSDLRWKLSDLELPETVIARSVRDIIAEHKREGETGASPEAPVR